MDDTQDGSVVDDYAAANICVIKNLTGPLRRPGDIRILELQPSGFIEPVPANDEDVSTVKAKFIVVNLEENPLFAAVSYVWEKEKELKSSIEIEGQDFRVTSRVAATFKSLVKVHQRRNIWIDAVCINQADSLERSMQVAMMGQIFSAATQVVAYVHRNPSRRTRSDSPSFEKLMMKDSSWFDQHQLAAIKRFLNHEYWTRRWVVQELVLARIITFHYGSATFTMGKVQELFARTRTVTRGPKLELHDSMADRVCAIRRPDSDRFYDTQAILRTFEHTHCSEPVDKIYALLSLMHGIKDHVVVDYDIPRSEVFFRILELVQRYESADIMQAGRLLKSTLTLSFQELFRVPESTTFIPGQVRILPLSISGTRSFSAIYEETFQASRGTLPDLTTFASFELARPPASCEGKVSDLYFVDKRDGKSPLFEAKSISAQDMYPFKYTRWGETITTDADGLGVGLSSVHVDDKNIVLSFPGMPVALIAQKRPTGFAVKGRAFILEDFAEAKRNIRQYGPQRIVQADDILVKTINPDHIQGEQPPYLTFKPNLFEFVQILKWTNLDESQTI